MCGRSYDMSLDVLSSGVSYDAAGTAAGGTVGAAAGSVGCAFIPIIGAFIAPLCGLVGGAIGGAIGGAASGGGDAQQPVDDATRERFEQRWMPRNLTGLPRDGVGGGQCTSANSKFWM